VGCFGLLKLTLHPDIYDSSFISAPASQQSVGSVSARSPCAASCGRLQDRGPV